MTPTCPHCDLPTKLYDKWQTQEQLLRGVDNYICSNGHEIEASVPLKIKHDGDQMYAIRADL